VGTGADAQQRPRLPPTVAAVVIPEGAHHLDLMFSNAADPASVTQARATEVVHIKRWIAEANANAAAAARRSDDL
jgi:hypothetical protein